MQAYLIDPRNHTITPVEYDGDWRTIGPMIGARLFAVAEFNSETHDSVFIDDEGLFVERPLFFKIADYPQPLAGRGLVLGCNSEGDSVEPQCTLEELEERVVFLTAPQGDQHD